VFAGDTCAREPPCSNCCESKSRHNAGIVTFLHQGFNQRDEEVATLKRQALMLRKPEVK